MYIENAIFSYITIPMVVWCTIETILTAQCLFKVYVLMVIYYQRSKWLGPKIYYTFVLKYCISETLKHSRRHTTLVKLYQEIKKTKHVKLIGSENKAFKKHLHITYFEKELCGGWTATKVIHATTIPSFSQHVKLQR